MSRRLIGLFVVLMCIVPAAAQQPLPPPQVAPRFTFVVNSTADLLDSSAGDGICMASGGVCTLRAAIQEANSLGSAQIMLTVGIHATTLTGDEDLNQSGDYDIRARISIVGVGSTSSITNAAGNERVFEVFPGAALFLDHVAVSAGSFFAGACIHVTAAVLTMDHVRLEECVTTGGDGGGLFVGFGSLVEIRDSWIVDNTAHSGGGIATPSGGGASNGSTITIERSLFTGNEATAGHGGAMLIAATDLILRNSTVSNNATTGSGGFESGGGIAFAPVSTSTMLIEHSTITDNTAGAGGGFALLTSDKIPIVRGSALGGNTAISGVGNDCNGPVGIGAYSSEGVNFVGNTGSCVDINPAAAVLTGDPHLLPLGDYGGANGLHSHVPDASSPLLDAADPTYCPAIDQRAVQRPQYTGCDLGSVERIAINILRDGDFEPVTAGGKCTAVGWTLTAPAKVVKDDPISGECSLRFKAKQGQFGKAVTKLTTVIGVEPGDTFSFRMSMRLTAQASGSVTIAIAYDDGFTDKVTKHVASSDGGVIELEIDIDALIRRALTVPIKNVKVTIKNTGKGEWFVDLAGASFTLDATRSLDDGR